MFIVNVIAFIVLIFVSYDTGSHLGFLHGLTAFIGSTCAWHSGAGLKFNLLEASTIKLRVEVTSAIVVTTIGYFLLNYSQISTEILGIKFTALGWLVCAFIVGLIAAQKRA
jgi:hypothetical protein